MKRSNPSEKLEAPFAKRQKHGVAKLNATRHKQPGAILHQANPSNPEVLDNQLSRALCIALHSAGFNAVKKDAFESLRALADSCVTRPSQITWIQRLIVITDMDRFAHCIKHCAQSNKRTQPLPQDFAVALAAFRHRPSLFSADLHTQFPYRVTQPLLYPSPPTASTANLWSQTDWITKALAPPSDQRSRRYVPKHFPILPPSHSYRDTPVVTKREDDGRKIRELATQEGVLAEQSLRRLVAAKKAGRNNRKPSPHIGGDGRRTAATKGPREGAGDAAFRDALAAVLEDSKGIGGIRRADKDLILDGPSEVDSRDQPEREGREDVELDLDSGPIVNSGRLYWRKGAGDILGSV